MTPTAKQMAAFLRAEGWKQSKGSKAYWIGQSNKKDWEVLAPMDAAYRLARRRKGAREARRLRKAGWSYDRINDAWDVGDAMVYSKAAALDIVARAGGPDAR
jgi:hypothetical protein